VGAGWNAVAGEHGTGFGIFDDDRRVEVFLVGNDDESFDAGFLVDFAAEGDAVDEVFEFHAAGAFGQNRHVVWIPGGDLIAFLDGGAIGLGDVGADDEFVLFQFEAFFVEDGEGAVFVQHDPAAFGRLDGADVVVPEDPLIFEDDAGLFEH